MYRDAAQQQITEGEIDLTSFYGNYADHPDQFTFNFGEKLMIKKLISIIADMSAKQFSQFNKTLKELSKSVENVKYERHKLNDLIRNHKYPNDLTDVCDNIQFEFTENSARINCPVCGH